MKWTVTKGYCDDCKRFRMWTVYDERGALFACRPTFSEAISYASHKAKVFSKSAGGVLGRQEP